MHALAGRVDIADLQAQTFTEAQAEAVGGEVEDPVAQRARGLEHILGLVHRENIGQALRLRRFDQVHMQPGLVQDVGVEELQPIQIELDRAPGMRVEPTRNSSRPHVAEVSSFDESSVDAACVGLVWR
jgi:hypothetical protein